MANSMQRIVKLSSSSTPKHIEMSPPQKLHELASFTCEICVEPNFLPELRFKNRDFCSHHFCNDCIIKYVKVKIEVDNTANIKCPGLRCDFNLDILSCRSILPVKLFEKWCDILFVKIILELDHCYCPNQKCTTLMVNECGGDVKRSICHNCKQAFCFMCKTSWHDGFDCEENEEIKDANDVAFGVLVEKNKWMRCSTKFCYKCGKNLMRRTICECYYSESPNRLISFSLQNQKKGKMAAANRQSLSSSSSLHIIFSLWPPLSQWTGAALGKLRS
ncbi:E3 ubiquitin-protein ligase RSL1-like [Impatiens glandulifera]|uniref:E3 ubiquitin-protein ligase RSL1-like n=1 Tax=Impatiens glandulifera TaxID=253017 RepID=UPI001FB1091D|nr:E3 ubiquitin-protein ligase RSL1-like [Impatiens glandulifera]